MKAKIGDVVIDKTYNKKGNLAIVVGKGISQPILIDHRGGITMDALRDYFSTWDGIDEVIGHIDFEKIWEEALRINEPNSEELNAYRECVKSRSFWNSKHCDGCYFDERCPFDEPTDEPQTDCAWGESCGK